MTEATLARYRDILQARLRELHNARGKSEGIRIVKTAGDLEESKRRFDPKGATVRLSSESIAELGIATGLRRIRQGTFGTCVNCGDQIGRRRLEVVPWTPLCTDCQRAGEAGPFDTGDTFFPGAA